MLNYEQFIKKYLGKSVEYDGVAPYQCVDFVKAYLAECYGIKPGSWGDAKYYFHNFNNRAWGGYSIMNKYFTRIKNTPDFVPRRGDILIFDGEHGHIAIAADGSTARRIKSYDQNYSAKRVTAEEHGYNSEKFLGVLRPLYKHTLTALNIRTGAGVGYNISGELKAGTLVKPLEISGKWARIGSNSWVSNNYLTE